MHPLARLKRALWSPVLFGRGANRLYYRRAGLRNYNDAGVAVLDEDWDNLLLLDGCRYDMFAEQSSLPGTLESRVSRGSATVEFLRANLDGQSLLDTVYVTANPQLARNRDRIDVEFHDEIHVWVEDGWDEQHGTVLPETMVDYTLEAAERYPEKRLLVHFMQPHYPFIGSEETTSGEHLTSDNPDIENIWNQMLLGEADVDTAQLWRAYRSNLDRVLPAVSTLIEQLDGWTVVTADHGNMVGERAFPVPMREWGHPRGIYTEELVKVPWLAVREGPRRTVIAGAPNDEGAEADDATVADRLSALGYRSE